MVNVRTFIKQLGSGMGYGSKGESWDLWLDHLKVREMPNLQTKPDFAKYIRGHSPLKFKRIINDSP